MILKIYYSSQIDEVHSVHFVEDSQSKLIHLCTVNNSISDFFLFQMQGENLLSSAKRATISLETTNCLHHELSGKN